MAHEFTKTFKTYDEQLHIIESRGLPASDKNRCLKALQQIGYYRLSGYWYPFRLRNEDHIEGIDIPNEQVFPGFYFDDILDAYELDRDLRHILSNVLDRIEIAIRVALAYQLGHRDPFAFEDVTRFHERCTQPSHYDPERSYFEVLCANIAQRQKASNEAFVHHYEQHYDGRLPVWVAIETWDFGTLNMCYQLLKTDDRLQISASLGISGSKALGSWLEVLRILRNMCAHHSRLNRRYFASTPKQIADHWFSHVLSLDAHNMHRLYPILTVIGYFLHKLGESHRFINEIRNLSPRFNSLPTVNAIDYGFPETWENEEAWRIR